MKNIKVKTKLGVYIYPLPVVIVGASVKGRANFMSVAWCSVVERDPPMLSISCDEKHYTNIGIKKNQAFSINVPSEGLIDRVDYIGMNSGKTMDKSHIFDIFYGDLKDAPMIKEAPVNMECKVIRTIETGKGHEIFIGEVVAAYAEDQYFTNSVLDITKIKPLLYSTGEKKYLRIGEVIGNAFSIGKNYNQG